VTICHSQTKSIKEYTKNADLIFIAIGKPDFLTSNMVKKGVVIVDVGINVGSDGKLSGDAKFSELKDISSAITPVPGGVGPMTIHALLSNTIELYKSNVKII
jgi:methylenetetrahydrofolate dehydrogenase (NADP+)/methenyltetrahydrofolate cyclohydrolase